MKRSYRATLISCAGIANLMVAGLHSGMIFAGPRVYQFLGAPQALVQMVQQHQLAPLALVMLSIATAFAISGCYALSAIGLIRRLPALSLVLLLISLVYCVRGSVVLLWPFPNWAAALFGAVPAWQDWLFSLLWLLVGIVYGLAWRDTLINRD